MTPRPSTPSQSLRDSGGCARLAHQAIAAKMGSANSMRYMMSVTASTP